MIDLRNLFNCGAFRRHIRRRAPIKKVPPEGDEKKIQLYYLLFATCSSTILPIQVKQQSETKRV